MASFFRKTFRYRLHLALIGVLLAGAVFLAFQGNAKEEKNAEGKKISAPSASASAPASNSESAARKEKSAVKREPVNVENGIQLAAGYIIANTNESGRVNYERHLNPAILMNVKKYNILRHAGTIYSAFLFDSTFPGTAMHETRLKLSEYILQNYVRPIDGGMYTVMSLPEEESNQEPQAKLGAAGLALIGMSNLLAEKKIDPKVLRGLGDFVLFLQKEDGSFHSKYNYSTSSVDDEFMSTYYPGEAALGLLYLYEADPQQKWLDGAKKALFYLADSRKDLKTVPEFDHWAMLSTEKLFKTPGNGLTNAEKARLIFHAKQMADMVIPTQILYSNSLADGSMGGNISPCSNGTKMEGLIAIYNITEGDTAYQQKVLAAIDPLALFLLNSQVTGEYLRGGLPGSAAWRLPGRKKKEYVIRIDNVQHVLSAWINYQKLERK